MALRFEAWTLPWSASFERVIADLPAVQGSSGMVRLSEYGEASLILPEDYDRLSEVISDTVGTLIRVYDGTTIVQEFLAERVERSNQDSGTVTVSGPDLSDVFNRTIVYPYDYPDNPSAFPDHVWGGVNLLSNPGFEDGLGQSDVWELFIDATGGTFALTIDSQTTSAIPYNEDNVDLELAIQALSSVNDVTVSGNGNVEVSELYTSASGGTFTMTVDGQTTAATAYNASAATIVTRLEALSNVTDVSVTGAGTAGDPWVIRWHGPGDPGTFTVDDTSLTGGSATLTTAQSANPYVITFFSPTQVSTFTVDGTSLTGTTKTILTETQSAAGDAGAWTVSQGADQVIEPRVHGTASISVVTTPVDTGSYALYVLAETQLGGAQQVVRVEPGGTYQASIRIRSSGTGPFRFVIRDLYENYIAGNPSEGGGFTVTANTWTTVTIPDVVIPAGVEAVIFRIAYVGTSSSIFYIDNAAFNEGQAASNVGEIVGSLMADAATDHASDTRGAVLDWIDYTSFDATNDSSGASWAEDLSITAYAGMTYGQFFDSLVQLGYEWRLKPKATPGVTTHDLEWYISGNLGTDHTTAASPAINFGQATLGGPVVQRIPTYTRVLAIGADGAFTESTDSTALTNFGPFESSRQDPAWNSTTTLTAAAAEMLDAESRNRIAVQVSVFASSDHARPLVDYTVGDTMYFQIPPALAKTSRRVRSIAWRHGEPTTYQITGSRIFDRESGAWEAVRRLLREFKKPTQRSLGGITLGGGKIPWLVAAADADADVKAVAGYVCDGTNDAEVILACANSVIENSDGEVWLSPGSFDLTWNNSAGVGLVELGGVVNWSIRGAGANVTYIDITGTPGAGEFVFDARVVRHMTINDNASGSNGVGIAIDTLYALVDGCVLNMSGNGVTVSTSSEYCTIRNTYAYGNDAGVKIAGTPIGLNITGCWIESASGYAIHADSMVEARAGWHIANNRLQSTESAVYLQNSSGNPIGVVIADNMIYTNDLTPTGYGVKLEDLIRSTFTGNTIRRFGQHGLWLTDCSHNVIADNVIDECGRQTTNTYDGIHLDGDSNGNHLTGNLIVPSTTGNTMRYGINVGSATCDDNAIVSNNYGGSASYGSGPFNDAGTNTITTYTGGAVGDNVTY